jgi:hypothetical protein
LQYLIQFYGCRVGVIKLEGDTMHCCYHQWLSHLKNDDWHLRISNPKRMTAILQIQCSYSLNIMNLNSVITMLVRCCFSSSFG